MKCPHCQSAESKVIDSRPSKGNVWRRRECLSCGRRFTTTEVVGNLAGITIDGKHVSKIVIAADGGEVLAVVTDGKIIEKESVSVVVDWASP